MIELTRLNKSIIYINEDLVESIEQTPDSVLTFVSGKKLVVREKIEVIIDKIKKYRMEVVKE